MKLAISNLACDDLSQITDSGVRLLECVFSKIRPILEQSASSIIEWKKQLPEFLTPYSAQSITYGCGLIDFGFNPENLAVIDKIIELSKALQLKRLVFGSPNIRKGEPDARVFEYIDEQLFESDIFFCIEPNARIYGGDYFFDIEEIVSFLREYKLKNIKTMIDTHNSWLENRSAVEDIEIFHDMIEHVHASEVKLQGFKSTNKHCNISLALNKINYKHVITFESINLNGLDDFVKTYK